MKNFYEILELSPDCSLDDIKNSYRQLCKIYHPDRNPDSKDKFIEIKKAYDILSDEDLRKEYDLDLMCSPNCKPHKINIKNNIELTLNECYCGCIKKYRLFSGVYDVIIPKYSKPGDKVYLNGLGWNGGDLELEIVVNENNNYFLDSKFNLHYILEIDIWEAILGLECEIKVFDEVIKCNIKPFTKTGDIFLLIGKGYPNGRYKTNLIIEIKVKDLLELNEEQLELVRKIKNISSNN
jgi:DnaJ-class molecular chaperone